jgi:hypothetical protein
MITLSDKWIQILVSQPETGMGYHVVSVILHDGKKYDRVVVNGGYITQVAGCEDIPFREEDIREIIVTHDKWHFANSR